MIKLQVIPQTGQDVYKLLRDKVANEAKTWEWTNNAKTRLRRPNDSKAGYIDVSNANGVLVAEIFPGTRDAWFFAERIIGRLAAWFPNEIVAINLQIQSTPQKPKSKKK